MKNTIYRIALIGFFLSLPLIGASIALCIAGIQPWGIGMGTLAFFCIQAGSTAEFLFDKAPNSIKQ